ncbi:hypothetical protein, partial [Desulfovibrio sp.]|uniref:hypothetical protein n=1 Tax=Desulfovibrio sp. TaxID=885 RepID=UPI0025C3243C
SDNYPHLIKIPGPLQPQQLRRKSRTPFQRLLGHTAFIQQKIPELGTVKRFTFEKGETRGGGTAPPGPK